MAAEVQETASRVVIIKTQNFGVAFDHISSPIQLRPPALIPIEFSPQPIQCDCYNEEEDVFITIDELKNNIVEIYEKNGKPTPSFLLKKDCPIERAQAYNWLKCPFNDLIIRRDKLTGFHYHFTIVLEDRGRYGSPRSYAAATNSLFRFDINRFDNYCFGKCQTTPSDPFANPHSPLVHL